MTIEDLIAQANHKDHAEKADLMQKSLEDVRIPLLLKHYKNSMSEDDKKKFDALSVSDQVNKLVENDYKLPHEHAEAFLRDVSLHAIKHVSKHAGEGMEKFMKILETEKDPAKRSEALLEIEHYMTILQSYGIRMDKIKEEGKIAGFNKHLFDTNVKFFGQTYHERKKNSFLDQTSEKEVDEYLPKISAEAGFEGFSHKKAKENMKYEHKRQLIEHYLASKKNKESGGIDQFKEAYKDYFEKKD